MAQKIASLYAEISADTSRAESAIANTKTALSGLGNSFGETSLKQQLLSQQTAAYRGRVKELAADVITGKRTFEEASTAANSFAQELGLGEQTAKRSRFTYMDLASKVFLAQQAFSAVQNVAKETWQVIGEGAQLELAAGRFDNLAAKIGTTSDAILTDFKAATGGMMSNAEMIASASQIIELGLADTGADVVRLGNVVGQLGLDMQQVIMTFANDSKMRLDALGLSVTDVEQRTKEYTAAGIAASKAFDLAVLDALEARLGTLGSAAGTTAGSVQQLEASWKNLTDAGKQFMALRLAGPITGLANTMTAVGEASDKGHGSLRNMVVVMAELGRMGDRENVFDIWAKSLEGNEAAMVEAIEADQRMIRIQQELQAGYARQAAAIVFTSDQLNNYMSLEQMYGRQGEAIGQSAIESWRAREEAITNYGAALNEGFGLEAQYGQAAQLAATQSMNAGAALQFQAQQQEALNGRLVESFNAFTTTGGAMGEYNKMMGNGTAATAATNEALFAQIQASTDDATAIALAGVALGQFSEDQANAMLKAALLEEEIRKQAASWDGTAAGLLVMQGNLQSYIDTLNSMPSLVETEVKTKYTTEGSPTSVPEGHSGGVPGGSGRASGGAVWGGQMYQVGEGNRPELLKSGGRMYMIPGDMGEVFSNQDSKAMMGKGGNTINNTWNVYTEKFDAANEQRNAMAMYGGV